MASYSELMAQAKELFDKAAELKNAERSTALAEIKAKMIEHGITVADLGGIARRGAAGAKKVKGEAKYPGPDGQLWSGKGRRPAWIVEALQQGKSPETFAI